MPPCDILPYKLEQSGVFQKGDCLKWLCDYELTLQIAKDITVAALPNSPSVLADRDRCVYRRNKLTAIHDAVVKANRVIA